MDVRTRQGTLATLAILGGLIFIARRHGRESTPIAFELEVVDERGAPTPSRVHLRDANGNVWKPNDWPAFDDHFVFSGKASLPIPAGTYAYEIERGPEYRTLAGSFEVNKGAPKSLRLEIARLADMPSQGWYAGDLHIHRRPEDVQLLMRAEDLHVGPVVTWWNSEARTSRPKPMAALAPQNTAPTANTICIAVMPSITAPCDQM